MAETRHLRKSCWAFANTFFNIFWYCIGQTTNLLISLKECSRKKYLFRLQLLKCDYILSPHCSLTAYISGWWSKQDIWGGQLELRENKNHNFSPFSDIVMTKQLIVSSRKLMTFISCSLLSCILLKLWGAHLCSSILDWTHSSKGLKPTLSFKGVAASGLLFVCVCWKNLVF